MSELREMKMGREKQREEGGRLKKSCTQCGVSHSHLMSATPGGSTYPTQRTRDRH